MNGNEWIEVLENRKSIAISAVDVHSKGVGWAAEQIPEVNNIYTTVDIDVLDPTEAFGIGTPEFDRLSHRQLSGFLRLVATGGKLVGADLVEVNPLFDPTGPTGQVAARFVMDLLGAATLV